MLNRFISILALCVSVSVGAQQSQPGASGGACINCNTVQDGSTVLGPTYSKDTCGLNYVTVSQKIGQRFTPAGVPQPATVNVSGLPSCHIVLKAFLWADASGNGSAVTASITNPNSVSNNFPMTLIGTDVDKCWSFQQTDSYRADVTSIIAGNGNYTFSGFPVGTTACDIDGFTLMIIYSDPLATYEGHIDIWDGAVVINGGTTTQTMTGITPCANSTNQRAFLQVADLQGIGATLSMNSSAPFTITEDWWNYVDQPTAVIPTSQSTMPFTITSSGDCYNLMMVGAYYQTTTCNVCTPQPIGNITLTSSATGSCVLNSGSVTTNPSGGVPPYSYLWQPGNQTTQTVTGLAPGSYTVVVTDASGCAVATDTVVVPTAGGPVAQFALSPSPIATFPGQLCMTDQTVGGASWSWVINGVPSATTSSYCYTLTDTLPVCVTLFVQDTNGCGDSATECVTIITDAIISIPNVFTPNNDNINDSFMVTWTNLSSLKMEIYDRWGMHIRTYDALLTSWDGKNKEGKECTDGVYYYICTAATNQGEIKEFHGFVHLLRSKN